MPRLNKEHGHEVEIIASTETFIDNSRLGYVSAGEYYTSDGIRIIRLPYKKWLPHFVMKKIRIYKDFYAKLEQFKPDTIMFHGMAAADLLQAVKYIKNHPQTKLYVDSHEDAHNSGTNILSKCILHRLFYRSIIQKCLPYVTKVLYLTEETRQYIRTEYMVPDHIMEYYPLGGEVVSEKTRLQCRRKIRQQYQIDDDILVIMHSGKLDTMKKTESLLDGLRMVQSDKVKLLVAGSIPAECEYLKEKINMDSRVSFVGWLNSQELREYLCASDIYAQPGTQSATMQNAICCGLPVMLYPYESHKKLCHDNVFWVENASDIADAIKQMLKSSELVNKMKNASWKIAVETLDYELLARRIER